MISRLLRPRFGLRWLIIGVLVAALAIGGGELARRRSLYLKRALLHELLERLHTSGHHHFGPHPIRAAYHASLRKKYERAARLPWFSVEPDPPKPRLVEDRP